MVDKTTTKPMMEKILLKWFFIILVCLSSTVGCREQNAKFVISISKGGGFTSLYSGCEFTSAGDLIEWQQYGVNNRKVIAKTSVSQKEVRELADRLLAMNLLDGVKSSRGNITYRVAYKDINDTLTLTWSLDDFTDSKLKEWYNTARNLCISGKE